MACTPSAPFVGMQVLYGKPTGPNIGDFTVVAATISHVDSPTQVDLTYTGGSANNVAHSTCAQKNKWGCEAEACTIPGLDAWSRLSDARFKRPI